MPSFLTLIYNGTGAHWDGDTIGRGYNGRESDGDEDTVGTRAHRDWDTMGQGHNRTGTQYVRGAMGGKVTGMGIQ